MQYSQWRLSNKKHIQHSKFLNYRTAKQRLYKLHVQDEDRKTDRKKEKKKEGKKVVGR